MTNITPSTIAKNLQLNAHKSTSIETKDATLIELLKRGTKVAVKCNTSDPNGSTLTFKPNTTHATAASASSATVLLPTNNNRLVSSAGNATIPSSTAPVAISLSAANHNTNNNSVKNTPVALTISQNANGSNDVYTLSYSTDSSATFFNENDVYNVPDTAMLLQAVDSIQLLQNSTNSAQLGDISSIGEYALTDTNDLSDGNLLTQYTPSRQLQAVLNSPLPESLAEFSALHSKDFVLYGAESETDDSPMAQTTSNSSLPTSPLSYPTPPASHEGITQSSPFLDDAPHFGDANSIFDDKKNISFLDENGIFKEMKDARLSDCEQILKLKHELFNDTKVVMDETLYFKTEDKTEYVTKTEPNTHTDNIDEFNQNLAFLDESRNYLEDSRNPSSPLSAAFFTGTMSSAEEVKEALQEVLPNESIACEQNTDIDLYYLPSATFQSQMMLNSDDPLLSSSPKDFIIKHPINRFEFETCSNAKKPKLDASTTTTTTTTTTAAVAANANGNTVAAVVTVPAPTNAAITDKSKTLTVAATQSAGEKITSETFLSPSNLPLSTQSTAVSSSTVDFSQLQNAKEFNNNNNNNQNIAKSPQPTAIRRNITYKSLLRKASAPYYTPSPILDPKRNAPGLYSEISKDATPDNLIDFEFAENACVPEFTRKLKVNIGSDFQAILPVPECSTYVGMDASNNTMGGTGPTMMAAGEQQMWNPMVMRNEKYVQRFVELAKSSAVPLGCDSEEMALKALQEANGEIPNAILKMLQEPSASIHNRWKPHEVETFLNGLEMHGKNFYKISQEVREIFYIFFFFFFSSVLLIRLILVLLLMFLLVLFSLLLLLLLLAFKCVYYSNASQFK